MESSDDSFAWTSASSDTEDSEPMAVEKVNESIVKYESDNGFKKKLQRQLFQEHDLNENEPQKKKTKKRRMKEDYLKHEEDLANGDVGGAAVKAEPDSDGSARRRRRRTGSGRGLDGADALGDTHGPETYDDTYLQARVKQEQVHTSSQPTPVKKNKKERNATQVIKHSEETECLDATHSKQFKKTKRFTELDESINEWDGVVNGGHEQEVSNCDIGRTEKKKSNQSKDSDVSDTRDMFSAEETVVETRNKTPSNNQACNSTSQVNDATIKESKKSKNNSNSRYSSKEFVSDKSSDDDSPTTESRKVKERSTTHPSVDIPIADESSDSDNQTKETSNRSVAKLSERLLFEDEGGMEASVTVTEALSSRLRRFLKAKPHLRSVVAKVDSDSLITQHDEVWILRCPQEVNIAALKGRDLVVDSKCKLKVDGRTYDGTLESDTGRVAILSLEHNICAINNVPLTGTINFRKRIPKVHFIEDNTILNNQTNCIPLPDTKCRHPLFGSKYKKRIKVPASVKARLNAANDKELPDRKKKKKHKRQHSEPPQLEQEWQTKPEPGEESKRRKRKHKHSGDKETATMRIKRRKHDPAGADATWDSETAIEQNLFSY